MTRKQLIVAYVRNGGNEAGITCDSTVLARFFARMYIAVYLYQRHRGERGRKREDTGEDEVGATVEGNVGCKWRINVRIIHQVHVKFRNKNIIFTETEIE